MLRTEAIQAPRSSRSAERVARRPGRAVAGDVSALLAGIPTTAAAEAIAAQQVAPGGRGGADPGAIADAPTRPSRDSG
jgi:hypothetical protein